MVAGQIAKFKTFVNRNQVQGNERNIDYWRKQGWELFTEFVDSKTNVPSKTQEKRSKIQGSSIVLEETPEWLVVIPLDKHASCFHGKHTDWCTAKPNSNYFERYFYSIKVTVIYCLHVATGSKWAIVVHSTTSQVDFYDQSDTKIDAETFRHQTGLDYQKYVDLAFQSDNTSSIKQSRLQYDSALAFIDSKRPFMVVDPKLEQALMFVKDLRLIIDYCRDIKGRWPAVEKMFSRYDTSALQYAKEVVKGRWKEGEAAILMSPASIVEYVKSVLRQRWPEGEAVLIKNPSAALQYIKRMLHDVSEWPEGEQAIASDPQTAWAYANEVLHRRWATGEPAISTVPKLAVDYAYQYIGREWPEAEATIMTDAKSAAMYAIHVRKRRWLAAEGTIASNPTVWASYTTKFNIPN